MKSTKRVKVIFDGNYTRIILKTLEKKGINFSFKNYLNNLLKALSMTNSDLEFVLEGEPICFFGTGNSIPQDFQSFMLKIAKEGVRFAISDTDRATGKEKDVDAQIVNEAYTSSDNYDYLVIFTGDHIFAKIAAGIKARGKKSVLVYNESATASEELKNTVDYAFIVKTKEPVSKKTAENPVLVKGKIMGPTIPPRPATRQSISRSRPAFALNPQTRFSVRQMKDAINQCTKDVNGFVFLADLGVKVQIIGHLKEFLLKYPQHFELDDKRNPFKVRIVGDSVDSVRNTTVTDSSVDERNRVLGEFVVGKIEKVDVADCSGIIRTENYGDVLFYFSDLQNPAQERKLVCGNFAKCIVIKKTFGYKVQPDSLKIVG